MKTTVVATIMVVLTFSGLAQAQHKSGDVINYLNQELIQIKFSFFTGAALMKAGKKLDIGFFGQNYDIVFKGFPDAVDAGKASMGYKISGFVLTLTGFGLLIADLALLIAESNAVLDRSRGGLKQVKPLGWALLGVGAVVGLTGSILVGVGLSRLTKAVRLYNEGVMDQARRRFSFGVVPMPNGVGGSFSFSF